MTQILLKTWGEEAKRDIVDVMVLRLEGKRMSACISLVKPSHYQRFSFKKKL